MRVVLPLIELIVGTGPDEKQLADKSTGILRSRIGKAREVPSELDVEQARTQLDRILDNATETSNSMEKSWTGDTDEFTTWSSKWREAITKKPDHKGKERA